MLPYDTLQAVTSLAVICFFALSLLVPRRWYIAYVIGLIVSYVAAAIALYNFYFPGAETVADIDLGLSVEGALWFMTLLLSIAASFSGVLVRLLYIAALFLYRAMRPKPEADPVDII